MTKAERAYDAYQARQHFLREQRSIERERRSLQQALEETSAALEQERAAREAEQQAKEAALAEVERLAALLRGDHPTADS